MYIACNGQQCTAPLDRILRRRKLKIAKAKEKCKAIKSPQSDSTTT